MFILRNNRYRAASLFTGILLLVLVISYRDSFDTMRDSAVAAAESARRGRLDASRTMREASFFQPIIQFTVKVRERNAAENQRALTVEEPVLYRRR